MTVLLVLAFFVVLISMDYVVTRQRLARESKALAATAMPAVEPAWVAGYQMPEALYYHRGHTWARPLDADTVAHRRRRLRPPADRRLGHRQRPVARRLAAPGRTGLRHEARRQDG